jgi:hypothetical protein
MIESEVWKFQMVADIALRCPERRSAPLATTKRDAFAFVLARLCLVLFIPTAILFLRKITVSKSKEKRLKPKIQSELDPFRLRQITATYAWSFKMVFRTARWGWIRRPIYLSCFLAVGAGVA